MNSVANNKLRNFMPPLKERGHVGNNISEK